MNKSQQYNDELYSMTVKVEKDIAAILACLSPSKLVEVLESMDRVYIPSDGSKCSVTDIEYVRTKIFIVVSPFGERYDLTEFDIDSKLTILEGLENAK